MTTGLEWAERSGAERSGAERSGAAAVARQRGLRGEGQRPHLALLGQLPLLARNVRSMSMMPQVRAPRPAPSLACALRPLPPSAHKPRTSRCRRSQCDETAVEQSRSESESERDLDLEPTWARLGIPKIPCAQCASPCIAMRYGWASHIHAADEMMQRRAGPFRVLYSPARERGSERERERERERDRE